MTYINLTGHEVHELDSNTLIPATSETLRINCRTTSYMQDGITYHRTDTPTLRSTLPDPQPDTIYIVSALALNAIPNDRLDVVAPKQVVRNASGAILGCRGFRHK